MRSIVSFFRNLFRLLVLTLAGALFVTLRYMLRTPQPLDSHLSGETRLYKWKLGYIFYQTLGSAQLPPLVLLHMPEIGASSYEMHNITQALSAHYRVYTLDLLGFGLSDHPNIHYSARTYIDLYRDFLTDIVGRPATLVATGLSCNYAVAVATETPALCDRLVLLSPTSIFTPRKHPAWLAQLLQSPVLGLALYAFLTTSFVLRRVMALQHGVHYYQLSNDELKQSFAVAHQFGAQHAPLAYLAGDLSLDATAQLAQLEQPTLIIWGLRTPDSSHTIPQHAQSILIQGSGTRVQEERPTAVITYILQWQNQPQTPTQPQPRQQPTAPPVESTPMPEEDTATKSASVEIEQPASQETIEAYCVKCRQKRIIQNPNPIVTKNGRNALEGTCPVCGTRLFRFI